MSRTTVSARRRLSLLASSSLVAASLIAGVGSVATVSLLPTQALAADECGDPSLNAGADDVFLCAAGAYATGITYTTTTNGSLGLLLVDGVTVTDGGVQVVGNAGEALTLEALDVLPGGAPNITNTGGRAIRLQADGADVTVDLSDVDAAVTITGANGGIRATTNGAFNSDITVGSGTITGGIGVGVFGYSDTGDVTIDLGSTTVSGDGGVRAQTPGGTSSIVGTGDITSTTTEYGVIGTSGAGGTTINLGGTVISGGVGVRGQSTGGTVDVTTAAVTATGVGIETSSLGGGATTITTNGAISGSTGISANADLTGTVNLTTGSTVTGTTAEGVLITATGGLVTADTTGGLVTGATTGVSVSTTLGGIDLTVGDVTGTTGNGVLASSTTGDVDVTVTGAVQGLQRGVNATSTDGNVTVTVDAGGSVTSNDAGNSFAALRAVSTTGDVEVNVDGLVDGGVLARSDAAITVNVSGTAGDSNIGYGVWMDGDAGTATYTQTGGTATSSLAGGSGVQINTSTGNIVLSTAGGTNISASDVASGAALEIDTVDGDVTGTVDGDITSVGGDGVNISVTGTGLVNLTFGGTILGAGDGIDITTATGDLTLVTNGTVTGDPGVILASGGGVITYDANADVTGDAGGITASNTTGSITVNVNGVTTVEGDDDGNLLGVGVSLTTSAGGSVTLTSDAGTTISGAGGVFASVTGAGTVDIDLDGSVVGGSSAGITAFSDTGLIDIVATNVSGVGGISATSTSGNVNVDTLGTVTGGAGTGVSVSTGGNVDVDVVTGTVSGATGVSATSTGAAGTVDVTLSAGTTTSGTAGDGVTALSVGGTVTVTATGSVSGTADGIDAQSGTGDVNVFTSGVTTGTAGRGIFAQTGGNIDIDADGDVNGDRGIRADSTGAATTVTIDTAGVVTSTGGDGINASSVGGTITVTALNINATGGDGIDIDSTTGFVEVNANGAILATGRGVNVTTGGSIDVDVAADITGTNGVRVVTTGAGSTIRIDTNALTTVTGTTGDAITANGTDGAVDIFTVGNVSGAADGIDASSTSGTITIVTSGTTAGGLRGVNATSTSGDIVASVGGTTSGGTNDGVNLLTGGAGTATAVVRTGTVSGVIGVDVETTGTGLAEVQGNFAGSTVTGTAGDAIQVSSTTGGSSVQLAGAGGSLVSTGGDGIDASSSAGGAIDINNTWAIDASDGWGILATASAAGDITIVSTGNIGTVGDATALGGILGITGAGASSVIDIDASGDIYTDGTGGFGVGVGGANFASAGGVTVDYNGGTLVSGTTGVAGGIFDAANASDVITTVGAGSSVTAGDTGVLATNLGLGNATVALGAGTTVVAGANGADASSLNANATVTVGAGSDITAGSVGAQADAGGNASVSVGAGTSITAGTSGIQADSLGDTSVTVGDSSTIVAGSSGIQATGSLDVTVGVGNDVGINAANVGIFVDAGDDASVTLGNNVTIDPDDYGVLVTAAGDATFLAGTNLNIDVNNTDADATSVGIAVISTTQAADTVVGDPTVDIDIGDGLFIRVDDGAGGEADGSVGVGGIVQAAGTASVDIDLGTVNIVMVGDNSIGVGGQATGGDVSVTVGSGFVWVYAGDGVDSAGNFTNTVAVAADSDTGNVSITSAVYAYAADNDGTPDAFALSATTGGAGTATIVSNNIAEAYGIAINAETDTGAINIDSNSYAWSYGTDAISAVSTSGGIIIDQSSGGYVWAYNDGIFASTASAADVSVTNAAQIFADMNGSGGFGINVTNGGTGNVIVINSGQIEGSADQGIAASSTGTGNTSVTNTGVIGAGGNSVDAIGINASSTTGTTTVTNSAAIDSAGVGIQTATTTGTNTVTNNAGGVITSVGDGINATSSGAAAVNVVTNATVTSSGSEAIQAGSAGGVIIVTNNAAVSGATSGIVTSNSGVGTTDVNANATVTGNGDSAAGISTVTTGTGATTIDIANGVTVTGPSGSGVRTSTGGGAVTVNVGTGGAGTLVTGQGVDAGSWVVDLNNTGASTSTLNISANATVRSTDATASGYDDLVVRGIGGSVVINNGGRLNGRVNFAGLTGNVVFNNTSSFSWHTTGASVFSGGADVLNNSSTGVIFTNAGGAATSWDFGAGADTFTNAGTLVVGEPTLAASTLTITNLETWNNSGRVVFGSSGAVSSDGAIDDRIFSAGTTFTGSGSSRLVMDANLGAVTQTSCAVLAAADCFSLTGGTTAGSTLILVNDISPNVFGAFNPTGIVLVDVSGAGATGATHFSLDPTSDFWRADLNSADGVLDKGLFFYDLTLNLNKQHVLVGLPDGEAFEFTVLGTAAQNAWYQSTGTWFDRQADLRDQLGDVTDSGAGIWMKIAGGATDRDLINSYELFGVTYNFDTSYEQNTISVIGGVDFISATSADSQWVVGGMIGYVDTDVNFDASNTMASMEGLTVGVYGTLVSGNFFLDGIVAGQFMDLEHQAPSLAPAPNNIFTSEVNSWGGQIEGGVTLALGESAFFEPIASLSYVKTEFDDVTVPGAVIDWDEQTSMRGSIGGRLGTNVDMDTFSAKFTLTGRVWNEFDGENGLVIHNAGPDLPLGDDFNGTFGEVSGSVNVFSSESAFSAFLNAGVKFKDDYQSTDAALGFRWRW